MKNSFISSFENNKRYNVKKIYVFTFILIFIISFAYFEYINRTLFVYKGSANFLKLNSFNKVKDHVQILFIGDSHFNVGIEEDFFDYSVFNLSFRGANYIQSYYLLKHYIDTMPSLKLVVIPLDLHSFSSFRTDRILEPIFWNKFIDYSDLTKVKGPMILRNKIAYFTLLNEVYGRKYFIRNLKNFIVQKYFRNRESNQFAISKKEVDWPEMKIINVNETVKSHFLNHNALNKDLLIYFEKILNLLKEKNILVVTVQMPVSKDYTKLASQYITKDIITHKISDNPEYNKYIVRNFNFLELFQEEGELFSKDGDHLNKKGREVFSKLLAKEISETMRGNRFCI